MPIHFHQKKMNFLHRGKMINFIAFLIIMNQHANNKQKKYSEYVINIISTPSFQKKMQLNHFALASDLISLPNTLDKSGVRSTLTQNTNPLQSSLEKFDRSSSIKNLKLHKEQQQLEALQQQNLMLKQEILFLRHKLKDGQMQKDHQALQLQAEVSRLKKIIEKSYYSIKNLETDKQTLYNDILDLKHISHKILTQSKALEQDKKILKIQLATIKNQHEEQINIVWQRVAHLQTNLQKMTMIIEEDRRQWKSVRVQSSQVSRPYHRRS